MVLVMTLGMTSLMTSLDALSMELWPRITSRSLGWVKNSLAAVRAQSTQKPKIIKFVYYLWQDQLLFTRSEITLLHR